MIGRVYSANGIAGLLLAVALLCCAWPAQGQNGGAGAADFDAAVEAELDKAHYDWRFPLGETDLENASFVARFAHWVSEKTEGIRQWLKDRAAGLKRWFEDQFGSGAQAGGGGNLSTLQVGLKILVWVLIGLLAVALLIFLKQHLQRRRKGEMAVAVDAPAPGATPPDLEDERTQADALPEDAWLEMAANCARKGDYRLGIRAVLLAILAHLGRHEFIRIARHKSNLDYRREVEQRDPVGPEGRTAFAEAVLLFESVWYGNHTAGQAQFERIWGIAQFLNYDAPQRRAAHG